MCANFYDRPQFALRRPDGSILTQSEPVAWDRWLPHVPTAAQHWLANQRTRNARERLESGAVWQCPIGHRLPDDFAEARTVTIALVGPPQTTKTTYLGQLIADIVYRSSLAPLGIHCVLADGESQELYNSRMARFLESRRAPRATERLGENDTTRPLVVRMRIRDQRINLLFFDASGESMQNTLDLAQDNPFLHALDAAIVFVTPRALALPPGLTPSGAESLGPREVAQVISNLESVLASHRQYQGRHPSRDLPLALVLSKADELTGLLNGRTFPSLAIEPGLLVSMQDKLDAQGDLPYELLAKHGGIGIIQAVFTLSDVRSVHAVSAMGCAPDDTGLFPPAEPLNIAEPLLAVLHGLRIIGDRRAD
ncbi:MAG: hypothetical protein WAS07_01140 [Micropruina sp.]|nr:hypothetical protein [Micropruina sp.]